MSRKFFMNWPITTFKGENFMNCQEHFVINGFIMRVKFLQMLLVYENFSLKNCTVAMCMRFFDILRCLNVLNIHCVLFCC